MPVQQKYDSIRIESTMKTMKKTDYKFKVEQHFRSNFSFYDNDFRVNQIKNCNFIVPWQLVENETKEVIVKPF